MRSAIGVPVVLPSNTPERMRTLSSSLRCVTNFEVPGLRRSRSGWRSASDNSIPGGQPSTTQPIAGPCDSPKLVTQNSLPSVLPDMSVLSRHEISARNEKHAVAAMLELNPGDGQSRPARRELRHAAADLADQHAVVGEIGRRLVEDARDDVHAVLAGVERDARLVAELVGQR